MSNVTVHPTIRLSILDLRKLHKDMSDLQFASMYQKKYKVLAGTVLRVLRECYE